MLSDCVSTHNIMLLDCLVFDNQSILCQQTASAPYFYDLFDTIVTNMVPATLSKEEFAMGHSKELSSLFHHNQ
jgi:hypothetical protein